MDRKAAVSLRFVIVGAGIAGLAAAYRLRIVGHEVCILEKRNEPAPGENAVTVPPNMSRILYHWGLKPKLEKLVLTRTALTWKQCTTGETAIEYLYSDAIVKDLGADMLFMKHGDLYQVLYDLAVEAGVNIRLGAEVINIKPWAPSVVLFDGEVVTADIVVGADGLRSVVRTCVAEAQMNDNQKEIPSPLVTAAAIIDKDAMDGDDQLRALLNTPKATIWRGERHTIIGCPLPGYKGYSLKMALPPGPYEVGEEYDQVYDSAKFHLDSSSCEPMVQKLLQRMKKFYPVIWKVRSPLVSLIHDSKKVVLIGEAAHTIVPNMMQNSAVGIEDAAVLANLASRIQGANGVECLLSAYHEIRYSRAFAVVYSEVACIHMMCMMSSETEHPYSKQLQEDQKIWVRTPTVVGIPDDTVDPEIIQPCDGHLKIMNHDVDDDVDEWWHTWGRLIGRDMGDRQGKMYEGEEFVSEDEVALCRDKSCF
ncbi:FAD/NAD(P)-binding domain-containing protein [Neolentinus lepideus HHB14362 ss-1]|uniref:FAD/NAD(P)-binding domain-containing protein n=1 Tax=Neolentinus lepideus HHB14362 ss-1 TaxID=1314782 RepID=A0A165PLI3_9AGAM|nr:FAD/NAD(P)-binding domain-containing protein [Neolentinus lepideus HHB14362 ss-1]